MKIEFPLKHIEQNMVFNRNGDVWAYFKVNVFNLSLLETNHKNIHIYSSNEIETDKIYIGFKLIDVYGSKTKVLTNIKAFFEGFNAQVNRSVGLEPYNIIKEDILDFKQQSNEIEALLSERMKVEPLQTIDIINLYQKWLNLGMSDGGGGLLNLNGISVKPFNYNTLILDNKLESVESLYVRYIVIKELEQIEYLSSLSNVNVPIETFTRKSEKGELYSMIRISANDLKTLDYNIEIIHNYATLLDVDLYIALGEQFILLYESFFGSNKTDYDYFTKTRVKEDKNIELSNSIYT